MATKLIDLIEDITQDDLPTNVFTIEDEDPMVILGKLNEVIAWLKELDIDNVESILELISTKLDKSNKFYKIYATGAHGDQTMLNYGVYGFGDYSVVIRKADGSIEVHTPQNINDATNKEYVDDADALKVDKSTTAFQLYGTNSVGNQTIIGYQSSQTDGENKIVQRDANSDVLVPDTPTSNNGASSKNFVNTYNMCPSDDNSVSTTATPVAGNVYFTAPANGMAYLRFSVTWNGQNDDGLIDFNIVGTNNNYLMYFSQEYRDNYGHVYMVNIPLKKGQKIRCNALNNITINWGGMTFIKSEGQS